MTRLKLSDIDDQKSVKLTVEIPVRLHRMLADYALAINSGAPENAPDPAHLVAPMLERFIASDRDFARFRRRVAPKDE
ncbi:MAG: DUF2274 domain-containing protein [Allopontixanthobacter sediminis]